MQEIVKDLDEVSKKIEPVLTPEKPDHATITPQ